MALVIKFKREKETKGTWRYAAVEEGAAITQVYVTKQALAGRAAPEELELEVKGL